MATSKIEGMTLDGQSLDPGQEGRLRHARRTAAWVGLVALAIFVFSIVQMLWIQHGTAGH